MDVVDAATRSRMMSGIRGTNTTPELQVRRGLHALGFRFRLHDKRLPGRPDVVLPRWEAVVFVNGCFWHAHHGCRYFRIPATRTTFWEAKLIGNAERDQKNLDLLAQAGWRTAVVWECALRQAPEETVTAVGEWLRSGQGSYESPLTSKSSTPE